MLKAVDTFLATSATTVPRGLDSTSLLDSRPTIRTEVLMRLIGLAVALAVSLTLAPLAAEAQQAGKIYRIGVLREGSDPLSTPFAGAMRELGWVEGQNLRIESRNANRPDQLPALAAELVQLKVDLILTTGTPATSAAKEATKTIPIVFTLGGDPVRSGLVASFARPGGNLTGWAYGIYHLKLLEVLKEALPRVSRVAFPATSGGPSSADLNEAALALGLQIKGIAVQGPKEFESFFAAAKRLGAGAVLVPNVAWFGPHFERIGAAAAKSHLPAIGHVRRLAESGGLLSYGPTPLQHLPRLATQIDKILKGAKPGDLPVELPTKFELVINLKTAKALKLTIPPSLMARADQVIE
jgi:putative ABC transport system substrate-binding protein